MVKSKHESETPRCDCDAMNVPHHHEKGGPVAMTGGVESAVEEAVEAEEPKTASVEEAEEPGTVDGILSDSAHDIIGIVSGITDTRRLGTLARHEENGKARSTVIAAIEARIAELRESR